MTTANYPPSQTHMLPAGRMPMQPSQLVRLRKVSPAERAQLEPYGWKEGDPVPANLHQLLAAAQKIGQEAIDPQLLPPPVPENTPRLVVPEPTPLESLPVSEQRERIEAVQRALQMAKQQDAVEKSIPAGAAPGVAESIRAAAGFTAAPAAGAPPQTQPPLQKQEEPPAKVAPDAVKGEPGVKPDRCPRCNFDLSLKEDMVEVTEEDKTLFMISWFGRPFYKTFERYGGKLKITLRSLTAAERDEVWSACWSLLQENASRGLSPESLTLRMRVAVQLQYLGGPEKSYTAVDDPLKEFKADAPGGRPWAAYQSLIARTSMSESAIDMLLLALAEFTVCVEKLEALCREPNF